MSWTVLFTKKADKQLSKLTINVQKLARALTRDLEAFGPNAKDWPNFSKLPQKGKNVFHCHLNYRYVAVWKLENKELKIMEVYYVGSREKAPY